MIYAIEHASTGDRQRTFQGMSEEQVQALLTATCRNPFDIVDEAAYDASVAASEAIQDAVRQKAGLTP